MAETFDQTYQRVYGLAAPEKVRYGESSAEIIRPARGFVDSFDLTMQTQVGCPAGCLFCYVPSGHMLTPPAMRGEFGENWGFEVRRKRDVIARFTEHLARGELAGKVLYWSGVTDPYTTGTGETSALWETLNAANRKLRPKRIIVQTRFRPDRDADLMAAYNRTTRPDDSGPAVVVSYSIGTDRDDLICAWERATPGYKQRMMAIETLRRAGVFVVPTLSPFALWDDLPGTLRRFRLWGIPYITCLFFKKETDSANTPRRFQTYLEQEYPMLLDPNWQRDQARSLRAIYGASRVLFGKQAFASLAAPQYV